MARIRSIKPELLEDERTARLSHVEWRLFVSLLLLSDDYGNLRAAPERIHGAALWAHPREDLAKALDGLVTASLVVLYVVGGQSYAHINGWEKHQKVDHPGKPLCPGVTEGSRIPREGLAKQSETLAPDQDQEIDQDRDRERADSRGSRESPAPALGSDGCHLPAGPVTSGSLCRLFGAVRSREVGGFEWQGVRDATGKSATMAEAINADPTAREDVIPSMVLLFAKGNRGEHGSASDTVLKDPAFAFGAWCSKWTSLREELHGVSPRAPAKPMQESFSERDARQSRERAEKDRQSTERAVTATAEKLRRDRTFTPPTPEQQEEIRLGLADLSKKMAVA